MWKRLFGVEPAGWTKAPPAEGQRVVLLEWEPNPSSAHLLVPWLTQQGRTLVHQRVDVPELRDGDLVVIVRYLTPAARGAIEAMARRLAGVVYFMDDDLWDASAWRGLPRDYRRRLQARALSHRPWLQRHANALWVSTPALAAKYAAWSPRTVPLVMNPSLLHATEPVWAAYHGTASHAAEIEWLRPVIAQALDRCPVLHVEIFGDRQVASMYRALPRVAVLHPMTWPAYQAYTGATRRDIGLAPLRPGAFNAARGAVKFLDYARMGAVGLYSDVPPYAGFVRDGIDGLLLPDDPASWADALVALATDAPRRRGLAQAVRERVLGAAP
jgi:hypothetical protein